MKNLHKKVIHTKSNLNDIPEESFLQKGRNTVLKINIDNKNVVVKFFKKPHLVNQIVYGYFRKSKAKRSFEYATKLTQLKIGTPKPISFYENKTILGLKDSYYICEFIDAELTFRNLTKDFSIPDFEKIIRAFTKFTFNLHEKGVNFLDHSPGNTLIKKDDQNYSFYLVDLNRMEFGKLNFKQRMQNFSRLTTHNEIIKIMSNEYAKLSSENESLVYNAMIHNINDFQQKFQRKKRLKKKIKFWKK